MPSSFDNEFSRPMVLLQVSNRERVHEITADTQEREALARRLGLRDLKQLQGRIVLRRVRGGTALSANGSLQAEVVQTCVATLEPLAQRLEADFSETFVIPEKGALPEEKEVEVSIEEEVEPAGPELISEGAFDLGEFLVQLLAERLDAFPRQPDAPSPQGEWGPAEDEAVQGPFADLAQRMRGR